MVIPEHHALVTKLTRMPLEAEKGRELVVDIGLRDKVLYVTPSVAQTLEPPNPMLLAATFHAFHVMPTGMAGKGEKIQMGASDIDTTLQGTDAVSQGVVVMNVAEKNLKLV